MAQGATPLTFVFAVALLARPRGRHKRGLALWVELQGLSLCCRHTLDVACPPPYAGRLRDSRSSMQTRTDFARLPFRTASVTGAIPRSIGR